MTNVPQNKHENDGRISNHHPITTGQAGRSWRSSHAFTHHTSCILAVHLRVVATHSAWTLEEIIGEASVSLALENTTSVMSRLGGIRIPTWPRPRPLPRPRPGLLFLFPFRNPRVLRTLFCFLLCFALLDPNLVYYQRCWYFVLLSTWHEFSAILCPLARLQRREERTRTAIYEQLFVTGHRE